MQCRNTENTEYEFNQKTVLPGGKGEKNMSEAEVSEQRLRSHAPAKEVNRQCRKLTKKKQQACMWPLFGSDLKNKYFEFIGDLC